ncbi:glycosyltransferase family 4 protein [Dorea sp. AF36-15AT]|uniref:glycosyltransferase family 4 protein n=1 Tax=Dorea sp. AF36-15AT TaxID=2292041 RepID=UPI000E48F99B|nr:glycosyltransferase family 4 protein [Dorea sp. AF36-15AT]RHP08853.1 glycosyltransferase [Dorea sp. AF36-15AT]
MKIAIIGHKRIPSNEGGIEKGVEQHAVRMVKRGHGVTAYNRGGHNVFGKEFDCKKQKEYKGIRIVTIPTTKGAASVPIYSFLATIHAAFSRYDCVSFRASGSCAMIPLAKLFGLRVVASLHGIDSQRDKWGGFASKYLEFGERMAATKADVCLVLSKNMKEYIDTKYGVNSILFANGIDKPKSHIPEIIKEKYGLEKDEYILSLGRIVPEKGLQYLIEAFKNCKTEKKLVIAGGSESNKDYYNQLLALANGDKRIIFTGYVYGQEVQELYSNAYIFALPSNLEGMANALLEAMSYGNCCLISDIPENTEVVHEKAMWFKKGNTVDLQKKLQTLLGDSELVKKYKIEATPYILEKYNWDIVVDQMLRVYAGDVVDYNTVLQERECNSGGKR